MKKQINSPTVRDFPNSLHSERVPYLHSIHREYCKSDPRSISLVPTSTQELSVCSRQPQSKAVNTVDTYNFVLRVPDLSQADNRPHLRNGQNAFTICSPTDPPITYPDQLTPSKSSGWVQLSGHQGHLQCLGNGNVIKVFNASEAGYLQQLQSDILQPYVPEYRGQRYINGQHYVEMQDLLHGFHSHCVMDCKMGLRTFSEKEVTNEDLRNDLYEKMHAVAPEELDNIELAEQAVTKFRFLTWRDTLSSTATLGFRVEVIKKRNCSPEKKYHRTRTWDQVKSVFMDFVDSDLQVCKSYLERLIGLSTALKVSAFFARQELIGTSLFFVHDAVGSVNIWMIDFGKIQKLPLTMTVDHRTPWLYGNHEDGYLTGVDNLIRLFEELIHDLCQMDNRSS